MLVTVPIIVDNLNRAPKITPITAQTLQPGEVKDLTVTAIDPDNNQIILTAINGLPGYDLPDFVTFTDNKNGTGVLHLTPQTGQGGDYTITLRALDGFKGVDNYSFVVSVTGSNSGTNYIPQKNHAPLVVPLIPQLGLGENVLLQFPIAASDIDGNPIIYSAVNPLPSGASINAQTGVFNWKPSYSQAGEYLFKFAATDSNGASDVQDVVVKIANVNRAPSILVLPQIVALGEMLNFSIVGTDLDGNSLTYSVDGLPEGAVLDAATGKISFKPSPGQVGDYLVTYGVSDGESKVTQKAVLRVETTPSLPSVKVDFTPSFPIVPGQQVTLHAIANSFTSITNLGLSVNGQSLVLDEYGRATFTPKTVGKFDVVVTATDAGGRVGQSHDVLKVYDSSDTSPPVVSFNPGLAGVSITKTTPIIGQVADTNLDHWVLSIAKLGDSQFYKLSEGNNTLNSGVLSQFDPSGVVNGFYQLKLEATDLKGRSSNAQIAVEVNSLSKVAQYVRRETDLEVQLAGTPLELVRSYQGGSWSFSSLETNLQTNVNTNWT